MMTHRQKAASRIRTVGTLHILALSLTFIPVSVSDAYIASKCTSAKVKATRKKTITMTHCWSKAAGHGLPLDTSGLADAMTKFNAQFAKAEDRGNCATQGDVTNIEGKVDDFMGQNANLPQVFWDGATVTKCGAAKISATGKKAACRLACHAKAAAAGGTVDGTCLTKCETKFTAAYAKAEGKGDCQESEAAADIETDIDAFVDDVTAALGAGGVATGTCGSAAFPQCGGTCVAAGEVCRPAIFSTSWQCTPSHSDVCRCVTATEVCAFAEGGCRTDGTCAGGDTPAACPNGEVCEVDYLAGCCVINGIGNCSRRCCRPEGAACTGDADCCPYGRIGGEGNCRPTLSGGVCDGPP